MGQGPTSTAIPYDGGTTTTTHKGMHEPYFILQSINRTMSLCTSKTGNPGGCPFTIPHTSEFRKCQGRFYCSLNLSATTSFFFCNASTFSTLEASYETTVWLKLFGKIRRKIQKYLIARVRTDFQDSSGIVYTVGPVSFRAVSEVLGGE